MGGLGVAGTTWSEGGEGGEGFNVGKWFSILRVDFRTGDRKTCMTSLTRWLCYDCPLPFNA